MEAEGQEESKEVIVKLEYDDETEHSEFLP